MVKLPLKGGPERRCVGCRLSVSLVFIVALHPYIRWAPPKCCVGRVKKITNLFDSFGGRRGFKPTGPPAVSPWSFSAGERRDVAPESRQTDRKPGRATIFSWFLPNSLLLPLVIIPQLTDANQDLSSRSRKIVLEAGFQPSRSPKTGQFPVFPEPGPKGRAPPGFPLGNKAWNRTGGPPKTRKWAENGPLR